MSVKDTCMYPRVRECCLSVSGKARHDEDDHVSPDRKGTMEPGFSPSDIDTSRPHPARMYDFYLGGKDNYPVDREAARLVLRAAPEGRDIARANRAFLQRVVRFLVVAAEIAPGSGVVYVDNDPIVHVHANALLTSNGSTRIVLADLREPDKILTH